MMHVRIHLALHHMGNRKSHRLQVQRVFVQSATPRKQGCKNPCYFFILA